MARRKFKKFRSAHALVSKTSVAFCVSVALLSGCKTTQNSSENITKPTWLTTTPTSAYLVYGVGSAKSIGDTRQAQLAAQEAARLELAKQLNVSISGTTTVQQTANEKSMQFHVDELISSNVPTIQLQGVKIEQEYQLNDVNYALASFNRTEAIMQTELSINALDTQISEFNIQGTSKSELLKKAVKIKTFAAKRGKLNAYLHMLQSPFVNIPAKVNKQLETSELILNNLSFNVVSDNMQHAKVDDLLSSALTRNGIKVTQSNADFDLSFRVEWQEKYQSGTYYSVAESYMVVIENGEEKAHFNSRVKAASSFKDTAKSNAMTKLAEKLSTQLAKFIISGHS
ncbi:LPP20 family lipoprotein [Pseudoalteromonas aurantia]|uniref:LPP20 family lipoprotein n=1 Tax=Pseudoalteromonas aurantia TaxID=43654 RepID=UPI001CE3C029|nr:LPP20 family lipoprotein [Pseudoalteromonas aurantia]